MTRDCRKCEKPIEFESTDDPVECLQCGAEHWIDYDLEDDIEYWTLILK